jgi:hypothetical protein
MRSLNFIRKNYFVFLLILAFLVYSVFSIIRPYEDDESLHILAGKAIIEGKLNPFKVENYGLYSNPFQYIMGSPLAPVIYGACYLIGGIFLARLISAIFILLSILLAYKIIRLLGGNAAIPLVLIAFSSSTILLASDAYLDSLALLFLMSTLYLLVAKRMFYAGMLSGFAVMSKFILALPIAAILAYLLFKKKWAFALGLLAVMLLFLAAYWQLLFVLGNFIVMKRVGSHLGDLATFFGTFLACMPIAIIGAFYKLDKKNLLLLIPVVTLSIYQILTLDFNSLQRHLPYAEFPAAILVGQALKRTPTYLKLMITAFALLSVGIAVNGALTYPSYNHIEGILSTLDGRVLALNSNSFMLAKNLPLNSTAENVFKYHFFEYKGKPDSIENYEEALRDGFFDYALISSYSGNFPKYRLIEKLVRQYYCPFLTSEKFNGIDIYKKC